MMTGSVETIRNRGGAVQFVLPSPVLHQATKYFKNLMTIGSSIMILLCQICLLQANIYPYTEKIILSDTRSCLQD